MGKTKTKIIDDSQPQEEVKKSKANLADKQAKKESEKVNPNPEVLALEKAKKNHPKDGGPLAQKVNPNPELALEDSPKKVQTPKKGVIKYRSKKYQEAAEKIDKMKSYPLLEAVDLAKLTNYSKFDGTLEIHINTSLKNVRGFVSLPFVTGKKLRVVAFGKGADECGADILGDDEKLEEIAKGKIDFDVLVTTPEWMLKISKLAKVLGPKGLMPNPKNGTISDDLKKVVAELQSGKIEYKNEKAANVIHLGIGKVSQPTEELFANAKLLLATIGKSKIRKAVLSPSMGPGIRVDLSGI